MTYIGAWFNGLTLLILGLVSMFSLPKTYEVYQEQIDAYLALAQDQVKGIMAQIHAKIPIGKKRSVTRLAIQTRKISPPIENGKKNNGTKKNPSKARQLKKPKTKKNC